MHFDRAGLAAVMLIAGACRPSVATPVPVPVPTRTESPPPNVGYRVPFAERAGHAGPLAPREAATLPKLLVRMRGRWVTYDGDVVLHADGTVHWPDCTPRPFGWVTTVDADAARRALAGAEAALQKHPLARDETAFVRGTCRHALMLHAELTRENESTTRITVSNCSYEEREIWTMLGPALALVGRSPCE